MGASVHVSLNMDTITYSAAANACENWGQWDQALKPMLETAVAHVELNTTPYNAAFSACKKVWGRHAMRLMVKMAAAKVELDTITYNAAVSACGKSGEWEQALRLLVEMAWPPSFS